MSLRDRQRSRKVYPWRLQPPRSATATAVPGTPTAESETTAGLPDASTVTGEVRYVTDAAWPGPGLVYSDGLHWVRADNNEIVQSKSDVEIYSAEFDGSSFIQNSHYPEWLRYDYDYNQPWSIEIVFKPTAATSSALFSAMDTGGQGWEVQYLSSGKIQVQMRVTSSTNELRSNTTGTPVATLNEWYHLVMTYDGSTDTSGIQFIIEGVDEPNSNSVNTLSTSYWNTNTNPTIGARDAGVNSHFTGRIHRIRLWSQTDMTVAEAAATRDGSQGVGRLDAWWRMGNGWDSTRNSGTFLNYAIPGSIGEYTAFGDDLRTALWLSHGGNTDVVVDSPSF